MDALKQVRLSDEKGFNMASPVVLNRFLPRVTSSYYRYQGSLTTPPCSQAVTFLVMTTPVPISEEQLQQVRLLRTGKDDNSSQLVDNFRPTFPLNGRRVFKSFPSSAPGLGPEGFPSLQDADDSYGILRESGFDDRFREETGASSRGVVPRPGPKEVRDPEAPLPLLPVPEAPDQTQAEIPLEVMVGPRAHVTSRKMTKARETLPETIVIPPGCPVARFRVRMTETTVPPLPNIVLNTMTTTTTTTSRDSTAGSRDLVTFHEMATIRRSLPETIVVLPSPAATHLRVPKTETVVHLPPGVVPSTVTSREVTAAPRVLTTSRAMTTMGENLPETIAAHPIPPVARLRVLGIEIVGSSSSGRRPQHEDEHPSRGQGSRDEEGFRGRPDKSSQFLSHNRFRVTKGFLEVPSRPRVLEGCPVPRSSPVARGCQTELASVESLVQGVGEVVRRCNYVRSFIDWPRHSRVCAPIWNAFQDPPHLTTPPIQPPILPPSLYENPATGYFQLIAFGNKKRK
ncbi:hypothetical protein MRX96_018865 [Rhipicephalus microplus]